MSTLRLDTIQDQAGNNASTPDEIYSGRAKAWVNFNGTFGTSPFTIGNGGIRAAFNVSSITDNGTGDYTINYSNSFSDSNYAVTAFAKNNDNAAQESFVVSANLSDVYTPSATQIKLIENTSSSTLANDSNLACVAVFR